MDCLKAVHWAGVWGSQTAERLAEQTDSMMVEMSELSKAEQRVAP